ncbi:U3 small nucleolar RNA-associated protein 6 homolog isoform X1 [Olea europaea var. sylvestris]|uniref:U3 small nucleolar RNA-associated protein 6 homolog isoform X1 n=1 Tax=Olea europaea var. sylvestris TaxID=158386 RepID=UPI000C1D88C0|nr:U3 small nucleolar RNA-associated protein 6 homolog isoform X1 [Olea europaea var. sylvestris]
MADVVQFKLERMLDELDDLERRGLFSRREIAEIVKQRRKFEYRLKRPSPLKQDFLAYIDYEKQLDALRLLRKKSLSKNSGNKKTKKSVSDYAGVSRIIEIYRLATIRFKSDIQLWFQYLEFCKARGHGRMKKALAQVIRFHPKLPGVWIYAAAWEFDHNLNVTAARALMQSGLRACPTSEDLWVEYLRMELTYLNKLKARKVALGEDERTPTKDTCDADEERWRDENNELFMALDERKDDSKTSGVQDGESEEKVDVLREHGLNVLHTVYNSAIEALPSSFTLRTKFIQILEATNLTHSEDMRNEILNDMKKDFLREPKYWDWLARLETADFKEIKQKQLSKAIQVYEESLETVPSATMFNLYVKFLMDAIKNENGDKMSAVHSWSSAHSLHPISRLQIVFEKAESLGCITEDLACQHVSFLLQLGKSEEAKVLIRKLCNGKFSHAVHLWTLCLSMEMRNIQNKLPFTSKADLSSIFTLLIDVLKKVSISEAENLWLMGLKYFANQRHHFDKLVETSIVLLAKDGGSDSGFSLSSAIVNFVLQRDGAKAAREIYRRFLTLPHPGLAMYRNCIELELNLTSAGDKSCLQNARKLYESALSTYSQDARLWQDYYSMEIKMGTSETAAAVHWRSRKVLKNCDSLVPSTTM